jgi:hypothetical protein
MREQLEGRLKELRSEFEYGRQMMADLEARQVKLRDSLLRIRGAIQLLEELLEPPPAAAGDASVAEPRGARLAAV